MAKTRDTVKAIVKEQFYLLGKIVEGATASKNGYYTKLAEIDTNAKDFNLDYIAAQKQTAANEYKAKKEALYVDAQKQLDKLQSALLELHSSLDLTDPALTNAIGLIKTVGPDLGIENVLKINESFKGNQPALKVLQAAYKSAGLVSDGGLDKQIYNIEEAVTKLGEFAQSALVGDGYSSFRLGVEIGKIANLEYVDFPLGNPFPSQAEPSSSTIDFGKVGEAARAGAGLS